MKWGLGGTLLITFVWFGLLASTVAEAAPLGSGLLGYWQFDGSGADSSGNGNTVLLNGSAGFHTPGLFGQALSLDGSGTASASQPVNNSAFGFGSNDFTVQAWVNFNSSQNPSSSIEVLIEKFFGGTG